jgi:hypothetical protein
MSFKPFVLGLPARVSHEHCARQGVSGSFRARMFYQCAVEQRRKLREFRRTNTQLLWE